MSIFSASAGAPLTGALGL